MSLLALQHDFMQALLAPAGSREAAQSMADLIAADAKRDSVQRFGIYHHAYRARLVEVMQDVFERTWAYLGDEGFADAARAYIEQAPSTDRTLNRFGRTFPEWLSRHFVDDAEISELAMIDWMMRVAFDAKDAAPIPSSALASLQPDDWPRVLFGFHPSTQIAPATFNAGAIWAALEREIVPPVPEPLPDRAAVLVWRKDLRPHFRSLSWPEATAIESLRCGKTFGEVCEMLAADGGDTPHPIGLWLRGWLDEELIVSAKVSD